MNGLLIYPLNFWFAAYSRQPFCCVFWLLFRIFFFFSLFMLFSVPLFSAPMKFVPDLKQSGLFVEDSEGVHFKYPIIINSYTVIPPDALLRVIYVKPEMELLTSGPTPAEDEGKRGGLSAAASRSTPAMETEPQQGAFREDTPQEKEMKIIKQTVWTTGIAFYQAFDFLDAEDLRIIYKEKNKHSFSDEPISFPEGMILAQVDSKIVIIALEEKGNGYRYGLKAGDQILAINDVGINGSLTEFLSLYRKEKFGISRTRNAMKFLVARIGEEKPTEVTLPLPPSLQGGILDDPFIAEPVRKRN
ncbi:signal protein PDZ [Candidatus Methylacidiphilum infernorum]|uniref:Signal protein PDZ n=1 Tax=Candidatus Methylacidiphilum infernorum TaxID=511746 RepID=A0ABX7PWK2_9BACT|nr:signal protein PDZ [Candidatus Methylacidiphilum infernorum]QSR86951.1 signal protein PDZ [Candidatus Methylacidiphilum infernorum]